MDRLGRRASIFAGDDSDDDNAPSGTKYPYGWFVIPVVLAIALACVVMMLRFRRRKLARTLNGSRNNALRQDIETMGPPRHHHHHHHHHRPWGLASRTNNNNNRSNVPFAGYYYNNSSGASGAGGGATALGPNAGPSPRLFGRGPVARSAHNEGLNEFGEAPPAYTARQKQQTAVEEIELNNMGSSQVDVTIPLAAATTTTSIATTTASPIASIPAQSSPPPYIEAHHDSVSPPPPLGSPVDSRQDGLERPPPAVLGSR